MTSHTSRNIKRSLTALTLIAAAAGLIALNTSHTEPTAPAPAPTTQQVQTEHDDLEGEIWWTTTDCPDGVQVPCLDPTVDPTQVPAEVAAQLHALVDTQWLCIDQVGTPMADGTVRLENEQVQECRQYAYLASQGGTGCWVEHKDGLSDELVQGELVQGELRLMPVGSTVVGCDLGELGEVTAAGDLGSDCWVENFGTDQEPEWVAVSDATTDGLCYRQV